ncbi:ZIP-like iron-zinc transporter [Dichomitus squalens]|uniref:ZIP-like iron-zinc transporter n=1 Tax=Dichomitus squalens TaxID=114155 RepID=A0A4V2K533_9APHY|nr:ZIP-like iron-zinc transporter [Dichomitus squalens]TBU60479.1 ZIP-like iron-zinc transporter [Dichomitus squalens]
MSDSADCTFTGNANTKTGLRIASIFIIMATSMSGALFPVLARRNKYLRANIPQPVFETAKYFGSGVIIATALIHLLGPAIEELGSPCLDPAWQDYPYPLGICLVSIFGIFITELVAFRWGTSRLARLGIVHDAHGHGLASHAAHGPETDHEQQHVAEILRDEEKQHRDTDSSMHGSGGHRPHFPEAHSDKELESGRRAQHQDTPNTLGDSATAQIIGIAILEFGVLLHSVLIGLTLAVDQQFTVLFVVLIFHQTFEGLGVGSRLAFMRLPAKYDYVPVVGGLLYGITTPIGIAVGLGVRTTYNPNSNTANIVSGILDSFSSGILLYTGLVELIAHEFLFNADMLHASNGKLAYALGCMIAGAGIMALLGRWA